jgi:precorrin-2 dehydrogenase / sirohydrochlorin ferrochelatase
MKRYRYLPPPHDRRFFVSHCSGMRSSLAAMDVFPAYFPLTGRTVVIAGSGEAADAKARLFLGSPANVLRVEDETAFDPETYAGAVLAFVASEDDAFALRAVAAAHAAHVPVNVTDRPALCDFTTPAVIDRGEVVAAVGTGGAAPLLASLLRTDIEARVPEGAGWVAALLRKLQDEVRAAFPDLAARRAFLRSVLAGPAAQAALEGDLEEAESLMRDAIAAGMSKVGRVRFIPGAGPAETLTLKAARILAEADVLAADEGADPQVLVLARRDARRAADATVDAMADLALQGLQVVRVTLGGADEQIAALRGLGVEAEKVR